MAAIYHFTDVSNVRSIVEAGALQCHARAATKVEVGNAEIKSNRRLIDVECGPGGKVCDYVPFYYATNSPMLFTIMKGNVPNVSADQRRIVYLVSSTEALYGAGISCVFTNGNAAVFNTEFNDDPANLSTFVDWGIMGKKYWGNTDDDGDRVRRRMAEFLVHGEVPIGLFSELGVYNRRLKEQFASALGDRWPIAVNVRRGWYF